MPIHDYQALSTAIHERIVAGNISEAQKQLGSLNPAKVPREMRLAFATFCRRVNLPQLALLILHKPVRGDNRTPPTASDEERAEYAGSLVRLGAVEEAQHILAPLVDRDHPPAVLFRIHALTNQWDYAGTLPLLRRYVQYPSLSDYERLVGRANLAVTLVHEKLSQEALPLLEALHGETKEKSPVIHASIVKLQAEMFLYLEEWKRAEEKLEEAWGAIKSKDSLDAFLIQKWRVLGVLFRDRDRSAVETLNEFRIEAFKRKHWETLRQLDYYEAICTHNETLLTKVCFGTPFRAFIETARSEFSGKLEIPQTFSWQLGGSSGVVGPQEEINLVPSAAAPGPFPLGLQSRALILALASDFYRPFWAARLHSQLFPDRHYHPIHSVHAIHQAVYRLRRKLEVLKSPLMIVEDDRVYRLASKRPLHLKLPIPKKEGAYEKLPFLLEKLRMAYAASEFSAPQAAKALACSERQALYILREAVAASLIVREGAARRTRYRLVGESRMKLAA